MTTAPSLTAPAIQALLDGGRLTGSWTLDPARSTVELRSRHTWGLRPVEGTFRQVSGAATVLEGGAVSGTLSVTAASVDTGNKRRDADLRSPRFFDADKHPLIAFVLERVAPDTGGTTVRGRLTVRDKARPLTLPVRVSTPGDDDVAFEGEVKIDRRDFGMTWNFLGMASNTNTLVVHAVFTRG